MNKQEILKWLNDNEINEIDGKDVKKVKSLYNLLSKKIASIWKNKYENEQDWIINYKDYFYKADYIDFDNNLVILILDVNKKIDKYFESCIDILRVSPEDLKI